MSRSDEPSARPGHSRGGRSRLQETVRLIGALAAVLGVALVVAVLFWLLMRLTSFKG